MTELDPKDRSLLDRIDPICERFEASLVKSGVDETDLSAFLDGFEGGDRSRLFHYLLDLEVDYRLKHGDDPSRDEYESRFPDFADTIREHPRFDEQRTRLGDYTILRELGAGGMGVVYEARQESLRRTVALKVLPSHAQASTTMVDRFLQEARAAGQLHHSNIVPVYDVGQHESTLYFAMQRIDGASLDKVRDAVRDGAKVAIGRATPRDESKGSTASSIQHAVDPELPQMHAADVDRYFRHVARIGIQAADALAHAHARGILHRDIKPSNLILDGLGTVWVLDFGLAKLADTELTMSGDILGTLRYMSPERFRGECDARADVFGLGLTLYELVTLRSAYASTDRTSLVDDIVRKGVDRPRAADPRIPKVFETILLKATASDVDHRYASAAALAEDLRRFVAGRPILARRASPVERLGLWARRNPWVASSLALVFLLLIAATVVSSLAAKKFETQSATNARLARDFQDQSTENEKLAKEATDQKLIAEDASKAMRESLYFAEMNLAASALATEAGAHPAREIVRAWDDSTASPDPRGFEWCLLHALTHREAVVVPPPIGQAIAFVPGESIVVTTSPKAIDYRRIPSGEFVRRLSVPIDCIQLALAPDGTRVAMCGLAGARIIDVESGEARGAAKMSGGVAYHPDGATVAVHVFDDWIQLLDAETGEVVREIPSLGSSRLEFSPDGSLLAAGVAFEGIQLIDTETWERVGLIKSPGQITAVSFSPDGRLLASSHGTSGIQLAEVASRKVAWRRDAHGGKIAGDVSFLGADRVVSVGWDNVARIWDLSGRELDALSGHSESINSVATSPDGVYIATTDRGGMLRVWDMAKPPPAARIFTLEPGQRCERASIFFSRDGTRLTFSANLRGGLWSLPALERTPERFETYQESPDGQRRAYRSEGSLVIDEGPGARELARIDAEARHFHVDWSPDGRRLAYSIEGAVFVWDEERGARPIYGDASGPMTNQIDWHPDGRFLAICNGGHLLLVDGETGAVVRRTGYSTVDPYDAVFDATGTRIAVAGEKGEVRILRTETFEEERILRGHTQRLHGIAWHPHEPRLATGAFDGTVRIWDGESGKSLVTLPVGADVLVVEFSPDGRRLAAVDARGRAHVWNASDGYDRRAGHDEDR